MYKLLFAEDESATRNGILEGIGWRELGIGEIRAEKNGELADRAAESFVPDILLTDIKMPRMDGITLSRKIRDRNPRCSILIISGYAEVGYLKSAIKLKAIDFVEKPIRLEELAEQLRHAVAAQDKLRERSALLKMELGSMLRYSGFSTARVTAILKECYPRLPEKLQGRAVLIKLLSKDLSPVPDADLYDFLTAAQTAFPGTNQALIFAIHKSCLQLSLFGSGSLPAAPVFETLSRVFPDCGFYFCAGDAVSLPKYEKSIGQANRLLRQLFYHRGQHLLTAKDCLPLRESAQSPDLRPLADCLRARDRESARAFVRRFIDEEILGKRPVSPERAAELCFRVLLQLLPKEDHHLPEFSRDSAAEWLASCVFLERMEEELLGELELYFDTEQPPANATLIDRVLEYIQARYQDRELSLNQLSRKFYVSNVYLCIRFKDTVGKTFVRYLTELRVQKAAGLLRTSGEKVNSIAEEVGFDNGSYFTKIFKKEMGMTPAEYRRENQNL